MEDLLHYFSHLALPVALAWLFFRSDWKRAALVMLLTMVVDLDHLLATPVFDPDRCSVGFHPLHNPWLFPLYIGLMFFPRGWRYAGIGLSLHMLTDFLLCVNLVHKCPSCLEGHRLEQFLNGWF